MVADADVRPGRRHARQRPPGPEVQRADHSTTSGSARCSSSASFGVVALLWFFTASIRRLGRLARRDDSDDGWLLAALASAIAAYAFGMLTFDAFNFVQVTMLVFLLAALGVVMLRAPDTDRGAEP